MSCDREYIISQCQLYLEGMCLASLEFMDLWWRIWNNSDSYGIQYEQVVGKAQNHGDEKFKIKVKRCKITRIS